MESVRTVHSLEGELVRLRESTKDALQQAWEEVETLQQQCAAHLEITTQLESDFVETKKKEEYWHLANVLLNIIVTDAERGRYR